jgi:hypothetical protein
MSSTAAVAQQAIEAPRLADWRRRGGRSIVQIEDRIPRTILADLEARGHTFTQGGRKGEVKYGYRRSRSSNNAKATVEAAPSRADRTR